MEKMDPQHLLVDVVDILDQLYIPYMITGGMAVFVWGRPRFTADIDIIVALQMNDIKALEKALAALGNAGYIDKEDMQEAFKQKGEFNFIDGNTGVKVDFWVSKHDDFSHGQFRRKMTKKILGQPVYFISPEDLILNKLQWYKQSHSSRHLEDVESIFKISQEELDKKYLKKWVSRLGLNDVVKELGDLRVVF